MLTKAIESKVDALWDKFWSGGIANPLTAMEQISYLLFMRRLDETDRKREEDAEWVGQPYKSIFKGTYVEGGNEEWLWGSLRVTHDGYGEGGLAGTFNEMIALNGMADSSDEFG